MKDECTSLFQEQKVWRVPSAVPRPLSNIHEHGDGIAMQLAKLSQKWLGCAGRQGNWGAQFCSSCLCFHMELLAGQTVCHSGASDVVSKGPVYLWLLK